MPRARCPVAGGTLEKTLEPWTQQMSKLADVLLRKKWTLHGIYAGSIYISLLLYEGADVLQNYQYKGSFLCLAPSWPILSPP